MDVVRSAARAFLAAAWPQLQTAHVVPLPFFHPFVEVGRDYYGDSVRSKQLTALEAALESASSRFDPDRPTDEREFPTGYVFSFLETFIARLTTAQEEFSVDGPAATQAIQDLLEALQADSSEVACCRVVSQLTTADGQVVDFGGVRVAPVTVPAYQHSRRLQSIISEAIPGAATAYSREIPDGFSPPESVLVATDAGPRPFEIGEALSRRIDRVLLLVRLLKPGTSESMFEVVGEVRRVRRYKPTLNRFRGAGPGLMSLTQLAERTIVVGPDDARCVDGLDTLLAAAMPQRPGMLFTSVALALHNFTLSYHAHAWYEQIVNLATAFEAAFSGQNSSDVTLRLKVRSSALLATDNDPATAIFNDVGILYGIRSMLVHGGEAKQASLIRKIRSLSTMPAKVGDGEATGHAVERLRDLVRRALLARVCLAAGPEPQWPLDGKEDNYVDVALADDEQRSQWRAMWLDHLAEIGAAASARRPTAAPRPGVTFLSGEMGDDGVEQ